MFSLLSFLSVSYETTNTTIVLTDANFSKVIKEIPIAIVYLYKKNISFCEETLPQFKSACSLMNGEVQFVIVDSDESKKTTNNYGFNAYPSYFIFRYGELSTEYVYGHETAPIVQYLTRISGKDVISINNGRDLRDFLDATDHAVVLAAEDVDPELLNTYTQAAIKMKDLIPFVIVSDPDAIEILNVETNPIIQLYRNIDRKILNFELTAREFSFGDLLAWVQDNITPRYKARNSVIFRDLNNDPRYTILAFVDSTKKKSLDLLHKIMNDVVDEFDENFTYVYADIYDMGNLVLNLGFLGTHDPCFAIVKIAKSEIKEKHLLSDKYDATSRRVLNFIRKFYSATVDKQLKSEELIPLSQQNTSVKKLVGLNFMDEAMNQNVDKLILCIWKHDDENMKAKQTLTEVADDFERQNIKTVVFFYIDLTINDIPVKLPDNKEEVPEIIIWPAGEDVQPHLVNGNATSQQIIGAIISLAKTKFKYKHQYEKMEKRTGKAPEFASEKEREEFEDL